MEKFVAGKYKHHGEYQSFSPSSINRPFTWKNPGIDVLIEQAGLLLGELNVYAELICVLL